MILVDTLCFSVFMIESIGNINKINNLVNNLSKVSSVILSNETLKNL